MQGQSRWAHLVQRAGGTDCTTLAATTPATVYFGPVEVRGCKQATEQVITYPHPAVKLTNGKALAQAQLLHRDHLSSVRAITNGTGAVVERSVYKPFGEQTEWLSASQPAPETKGWIGERFDADAGLQYLNARYYDPVLGMFLQPDWWEVRTPGVGTNRFSYSFNDPVNGMDPGGNKCGGACGKAKSKGGYDIGPALGRIGDMLGAAARNPREAAGGALKGAIRSARDMSETGPTGILNRAVNNAIISRSPALDSYLNGQMTDAEQGGNLIAMAATGVIGLRSAAVSAGKSAINGAKVASEAVSVPKGGTYQLGSGPIDFAYAA